MGRLWSLVLGAAVATAGAEARADDSCSLASNGICEEEHVGRGYCAQATDETDCATAYVIPRSDVARLNADDLRYFSAYGLRLAHNEIFARHGYRFDSEDLQAFFGRRAWYTPVGRDVALNADEQANVALLRGLEDGTIPRASQDRRAPDRDTLPPWTAWQADVVHADGTVEIGIVDGVRARVTDPETGVTVLIRVDRGDALHYGQEENYGAVFWWGQFPPVLIEPFAQAFWLVSEPLGREVVLGENVTRVRLDFEAEFEILDGEAWVTDDGIFIKVAVGGEYRECCGGERGLPWRLDYELHNLQRGRPDPGVMEPPPFYQWTYPEAGLDIPSGG
jgi:hypothetical protein